MMRLTSYIFILIRVSVSIPLQYFWTASVFFKKVCVAYEEICVRNCHLWISVSFLLFLFLSILVVYKLDLSEVMRLPWMPDFHKSVWISWCKIICFIGFKNIDLIWWHNRNHLHPLEFRSCCKMLNAVFTKLQSSLFSIKVPPPPSLPSNIINTTFFFFIQI